MITEELLQYFATDWLFQFLLVFVRFSGAFVVMPGIGDNFVTPRTRLAFGLLLTIVITPVLRDQLPGLPNGPVELAVLIAMELVIGAFFGLLMRAMFTALELAGFFMSFQSSLANATIFNPALAGQGSIISIFFAVSGATLLFALNLHHLMLQAIISSYEILPVGSSLPVGDFAQTFARLFNDTFQLAFQMASPLIIVGSLFYLALGLLGRLMPQVQVFFIAIPAQILLGFFVILITLSISMFTFMSFYENNLEAFLGSL